MKSFAYALGSVLLSIAPASAVPLTGTGGAENAIVGGTTIDFDSAPAGRVGSVTLSGVTISAAAGTVLEIGNAFVGSFNTRGTQSLFNTRAVDSFTSIEFDFGGAVNAFAFNWGASDALWTLTAFDAANQVIESLSISPTLGSNAGDYFGISAAGIARATLAQDVPCTSDCPIDFVFIDNLTFGDRGSVDVPAPAGIALLGASLIGLAVARRR